MSEACHVCDAEAGDLPIMDLLRKRTVALCTPHLAQWVGEEHLCADGTIRRGSMPACHCAAEWAGVRRE